MLVVNVGPVIVGVAMLRAMVVTVVHMRDVRCMGFTAHIAKKTGERRGDALRRQHYERK